MKTKTKWVKAVLFFSAFAAGTVAVQAQSQTPSQIFVRELQAKRVQVYQQIVDLQSNQATINQSIAGTQAQIQDRQNAIGQLNQLIAASTDPNEIAAYNQKIQGLDNEINNTLQPGINQMQAKLAGIPASIAQVQAKVDIIDNDIAKAQAVVARETAYAQQQSQPAPSVAAAQATPPPPALSTPRDPNNPNALPLLPSSGNAEQDAALLRQWLLAHPIVK